MSAAKELLVRTHKTAQTGKNTMEKLIPMLKDRDLGALAQMQLDEYNRIFISSEILLRSNGIQPSGVPAVSQAVSNMMINVNMVANKSAPHAAGIMVEATDKGIKDIDIAIAQFGPSASAEAFNLASTLRDCLYRNRRELQRYK
jgi:hypothetical protein